MRSRTLEAVRAVERRLRAGATAATALAVQTAGDRRRNCAALARDLQIFNASVRRSAFACAASAAHRKMLAIAEEVLAARQQAADDAARAARAAVLPWAQIRCGLERRCVRQAAKSPA